MGRIEMVKILLKYKANVNIQNKEGGTPLYYASMNGYSDIVFLLLKYGANPMIVTKKDKAAPIHSAASRGCIQCFQMLIENNPQTIILKGPDNQLPLHFAVLANRNSFELTTLILQNSCMIFIFVCKNQTQNKIYNINIIIYVKICQKQKKQQSGKNAH